MQKRRLQMEAQERVFRLQRDLDDARRHLLDTNKAAYESPAEHAAVVGRSVSVGAMAAAINAGGVAKSASAIDTVNI